MSLSRNYHKSLEPHSHGEQDGRSKVIVAMILPTSTLNISAARDKLYFQLLIGTTTITRLTNDYRSKFKVKSPFRLKRHGSDHILSGDQRLAECEQDGLAIFQVVETITEASKAVINAPINLPQLSTHAIPSAYYSLQDKTTQNIRHRSILLENRSTTKSGLHAQERQRHGLSLVSSNRTRLLTSPSLHSESILGDRLSNVQDLSASHTSKTIQTSSVPAQLRTTVREDQVKQEVQSTEENVWGSTASSDRTNTEMGKKVGDNSDPQSSQETGSQHIEANTGIWPQLLKKLQTLFHQYSSSKYTNTVRDLLLSQSDNTQPHTSIGFVGDTGSGKSTLINALLKCADLAPTSNVRARTAVVTEYRYNHEAETGHRFRAIVHFIDEESWLHEVRALINSLIDDDGRMPEKSPSTYTEAGIAWDKLSVIYPNIDKQQLCSKNPYDLLRYTIGDELLGSTREFHAQTSRALSEQVTKFITAEGTPTTTTREGSSPVLWPLVKMVVIYVDAPLLQSGVTLVDLPGTRDSNKARNAIAENYARECSHLFIIATIARAVNNKTVKDLLNDSLLRRLKLDDMVSRVTFVGTQAESIGTKSEAADSLDMAAQIASFQARRDELDATLNEHYSNLQQKEKEHNNLKDAERKVNASLAIHRRSLQQKLCLEVGLVDGLDPRQNKRKLFLRKAGFRKRIMIDRQGSHMPRSSVGIDMLNVSPATSPGPQLSANDTVAEKLSELESNLEDLAAAMNCKADEIDKLMNEINGTIASKSQLDFEEWNQIVVERNTAVKEPVRLLFAASMREHDQKLARLDPQSSTTDDAKDYGKFSEALTICCVSARGYQRLLGLLPKEQVIDLFETEAQTGVPELQDHISKLSQKARNRQSKQYMNKVAVLLNSIKLWVTKSSTARDSDAHESADIEIALKKFQTDFNIATISVCSTILVEVETSIFRRFPSARTRADAHTTETLDGWRQIMFQTFKAISSHHGVFTNKTDSYDFNQELADPMLDHIALDWIQYFGTELQLTLNTHAADCKKILEIFYTSVQEKAKQIGIDATVLHVLTDQFTRYKSHIDTTFRVLKEDILLDSRKGNRMFASNITYSMHSVYEEAMQERGQGSDRRRKDIVCQGVSFNEYTIFSQATNAVEKYLRNTVACHEDIFLEAMRRASRDIERDYTVRFAPSTSQRAPRDPDHDLKEALKWTLKRFDSDIEFLNNHTIDV